LGQGFCSWKYSREFFLEKSIHKEVKIHNSKRNSLSIKRRELRVWFNQG
jgi:hypothetical protein